MELTHSFTVPVDVPEAWAAFTDIAATAECFPGAVVTGVDGDSFEGTVKVKLGPVALQYAGSGTFVEKDESARRLVLDAKGRDKRGNGTAGAKVTATFVSEGPSSTRVQVVSDVAITGKPAQFGRGVLQDVSDKLLGQFVACLESRVARPPEAAVAEPGPVPAVAAEPSPAADVAAAGPAADPALDRAPGRAAGEDGALDLGATVLPILLRSYGRQAAAVLAGLLAVAWIVRALLGRRD